MSAETYTIYVPPPQKPPGPLESRIRSLVYPLSHSPKPSVALAALFASTLVMPPGKYANLPSIFWRLGFTWIFAGTGYMLSTGDIRNGSGTTTGCAMIYLWYHARQALRRPRDGPSLLLTGCTAAAGLVYGSEYFRFRRFDDEAEYSVKF